MADPVRPAEPAAPQPSDTSKLHRAEVAEGKRFEFGKNWSHFLAHLTPERIQLAEESVRKFLQSDRLDGKSFLDVGSGSGLFSLAARRLGARVRSFDFDPQSVACTRELRRRYFPDDNDWTVEQGSVLDRSFLGTLGTHDIVYSWGVLHHTGEMWEALENVKPLVAQGGQLFIAIYNDQGEATDQWARVKQRYNALPRPLAFLFALGIIGKHEGKAAAAYARSGTIREWLKTWTEYDRISTRGMSKWHDWIDWIGGYPYERASVDQIVDWFAKDGFRLTRLEDRSMGYGCNEFVFRREAGVGTYIDTPIPGGRWMVRQFGRRVVGPFEQAGGAWTGTAQVPPALAASTDLHVLRDNEILGQATIDESHRVVLPPGAVEGGEVSATPLYVVGGERRELRAPYHVARGRMWYVSLPDLAHLADSSGQGNDTRSCVFLFENDRQLPYPHSIHNEIAEFGGGRFSHWNTDLLFSATDGSDPNTNGRRYELIVARWE